MNKVDIATTVGTVPVSIENGVAEINTKASNARNLSKNYGLAWTSPSRSMNAYYKLPPYLGYQQQDKEIQKCVIKHIKDGKDNIWGINRGIYKCKKPCDKSNWERIYTLPELVDISDPVVNTYTEQMLPRPEMLGIEQNMPLYKQYLVDADPFKNPDPEGNYDKMILNEYPMIEGSNDMTENFGFYKPGIEMLLLMVFIIFIIFSMAPRES